MFSCNALEYLHYLYAYITVIKLNQVLREKEHIIKVVSHVLRCGMLIGLTFSASNDILRVFVNPNGFLIGSLILSWEAFPVCMVPTYCRLLARDQ